MEWKEYFPNVLYFFIKNLSLTVKYHPIVSVYVSCMLSIYSNIYILVF